VADAVSYEVTDGVAHVTIERPDRRNAMSLEVFDQLTERAAQAQADPGVGAVVVAGRGGTFSSGIDVSVFGDQLQDGVDAAFIARLQAAFTAYEDLDVPTIAAIEGYCFGGGIQLAAACHLRAVAPSAELAVMEARWGLVPDLGGTWRLPRLVGLGRATELTLTARRVGADEAVAIGLAELRLDADDPQADAHDRAARLAAGPGAVRRAPRLLRENLERDRTGALAAEAGVQVACIEGPDFTEAVTAHLQGREPRFVGR
jgi:enoyl-CoA hydratase/carnithine racemase